MRKRKIFALMLVCCLILALSACGEDTSSNNKRKRTHSTVKEQDKIESNEMSEGTDEEVENINDIEWSSGFDDSYKPVFYAHPLLKGKDLCGAETVTLERILGTPIYYDDITSVYSMKNKDGVEIYFYVLKSIKYNMEEDNPNGVSVISDIRTSTNIEYSYHNNDLIIVDYLLGNKDYVMSNEGYKKILDMHDIYWDAGNPSVYYEMGYKEYAEMLGAPGFLYYQDKKNISVAWAYTDGEQKGGIVVNFVYDKPEESNQFRYIE